MDSGYTINDDTIVQTKIDLNIDNKDVYLPEMFSFLENTGLYRIQQNTWAGEIKRAEAKRLKASCKFMYKDKLSVSYRKSR